MTLFIVFSKLNEPDRKAEGTSRKQLSIFDDNIYAMAA